MKARNPIYTADGAVDLELEHPQYGWIPFTASPDDLEAHSRELYARAIAGEFGPVAPYVPAPPPPPAPPVVPTRVEMAQARLALLQEGLLDDVEAAMSSMPRDAQIEWEFRSHVVRNSPLVTALAAQLHLNDTQLDALFTLAASL